MQFLILGMLALVVVLYLLEVKRGARSGVWVRRIRIAVGILVLAVAAGLFVRGAAGPASALSALGFWLVSATGSGVFGLPGGSKTPGQTSQINTAYLEVSLDHDTGALTGRVIKGAFSGRALETLTAADLIDLLQVSASDDPPSAQVIEAVLDRQHPDWRDWSQENGLGDDAHFDAGASGDDGIMSHAQAYKVLGLKPGASELEIRAAHRDLMQKVHPDHGGSTVLAAQINRAKDVLLG